MHQTNFYICGIDKYSNVSGVSGFLKRIIRMRFYNGERHLVVFGNQTDRIDRYPNENDFNITKTININENMTPDEILTKTGCSGRIISMKKEECSNKTIACFIKVDMNTIKYNGFKQVDEDTSTKTITVIIWGTSPKQTFDVNTCLITNNSVTHLLSVCSKEFKRLITKAKKKKFDLLQSSFDKCKEESVTSDENSMSNETDSKCSNSE